MGSSKPQKCDPDQKCKAGSASPSQGGQTAEDCQPGQYLNVNVCDTCLPGFVCDLHTNQKYPIDPIKDGGTECPVGKYCPAGSTSATALDCPPGTSRLYTRGRSEADCNRCSPGSAQSSPGSTTCIVCGAGSQPNEDQTTCECIGSFRSWQETTNTCVCEPNYNEPVAVVGSSISTLNQDCVPNLSPTCNTQFNFVDEKNQCVSKDSCVDYWKCKGEGFFDETLNSCFCNNVEANPAAYCDSACKNASLKAYITDSGNIILSAGNEE
jgi:hypothetical protein